MSGPLEHRPCVVCGARIAPGEAYVAGVDGPVHARHPPDEPPAATVGELSAHAREDPDANAPGPSAPAAMIAAPLRPDRRPHG